MYEKCVHCGDLVTEARTLSPFGLMHVLTRAEACADGSGHFACTVQIGFE